MGLAVAKASSVGQWTGLASNGCRHRLWASFEKYMCLVRAPNAKVTHFFLLPLPPNTGLLETSLVETTKPQSEGKGRSGRERRPLPRLRPGISQFLLQIVGRGENPAHFMNHRPFCNNSILINRRDGNANYQGSAENVIAVITYSQII